MPEGGTCYLWIKQEWCDKERMSPFLTLLARMLSRLMQSSENWKRIVYDQEVIDLISPKTTRFFNTIGASIN